MIQQEKKSEQHKSTIRVIFQYVTDALQKKTDKIQISQDATTDQLFKQLARKLNCKPQQLNIKFKRDGCVLKVIKGWTLSFYLIKEGSILNVEQRELEMNSQEKQRQKYLQKLKFQNMANLGIKNNKLSVLNEADEEESEKESDNQSDNLEVEEDEDGDQTTKAMKQFLDATLNDILTFTKQGKEQEIMQAMRFQDCPQSLSDEQKKDFQVELINQNGVNGWNPLHYSIFQGHFNIFKLYINNKADCNKLTNDGWSPLILATHKNNIEMGKVLLKQENIDVNFMSPQRESALHTACRKGNIKYIKLLLENKADPNLLNEQHETPLNVCQNKEVQQEYQQLVEKIIQDKNRTKSELQNLEQGNPSRTLQDEQKIKDNTKSPVDQAIFNNMALSPKRQNGLKIGQPQRPPILRGFAHKHGNWTLTIRKRFYVLNPDQGTLIKYKSLDQYPMKPMEVLPLSNITNVQSVDRSWYMKGNIHYFEYTYNQQIYKMGFKHTETTKNWAFFLRESVRYNNFMEENPEIRQKIQQEPNQEIDLYDDPVKDQQISQQFKNYMLGKHQQKRPQSPPPNRQEEQKLEEKMQQERKVYYNNEQQNQQQQQLQQQQQKKSNSSNNNYQQPKPPSIGVPDKQSNNDNQNVKVSDNFSKSSQNQSQTKKTQASIDSRNSSVDLGELEVANVKWESFDFIKMLGRGAFGKVFLAKKKDNGKVYAIKALKKRQLIMKKQLKYAVTEANVLKMCDNPFVLKLHFAFQTPNYMYLVLDYCPGGDLSLHLAQLTTFDEDTSRFYIAELILAIEHIHEKDVVYRDLKPENILIDSSGHIKLADFGLSKDRVADQDNTKSFCGSPAYLSPEMLNQQGAGKPSDIYGIGAVLYEMLTGDPPYYNDDIPTMYQNIKNGALKFPSRISQEAKDIIKKMLDRNPHTRLGCKNKQDLKNHPFFASIDWEKLSRKELTPPEINIELNDDDEDELELLTQQNQNRPFFVDHDYTENNKRVNRVINYTFARPNDI